MEFREAQPYKAEPGPIYNFRRGYRVNQARRHESADEYAVFQEYLRLPSPRTFSELSRRTGHTPSALSKWAKKWNWDGRAVAWQQSQLAITMRDVDKMKREAHKRAIVEFRGSSERQARLMSGVSEDLVRVIGKRIQEIEDRNEEIPIHMVGGLLRAAASIHEQSRQAWGHALGVNELLEVVESEVEKVRIEELELAEDDPYEFEIEG